MAFSLRKQWPEIIEYLKNLDEGDFWTKVTIAKAHHFNGDTAKARVLLADLENEAEESLDNFSLTLAFALIGDEEKAGIHAAKFAAEEGVSPWRLAQMYAAMGDLDQAFSYLDICYELRVNWMTRLGYLVNKPLMGWASLEDDPRYPELLKKIGITK